MPRLSGKWRIGIIKKMIIAMTGKKEKEILDNDYIVKENAMGGRRG